MLTATRSAPKPAPAFTVYSAPQGTPTPVAAANAVDVPGATFSLRCTTCSTRLTGVAHLQVVTHFGDDHRYCNAHCHGSR